MLGFSRICLIPAVAIALIAAPATSCRGANVAAAGSLLPDTPHVGVPPACTAWRVLSANAGILTEPKVSVTPKTGGIRDIGDMNNPVVAVKTWCVANRNERSEINLTDLAQFIKEELHSEPQRVVEEAFKQAILMPSPAPGKAVVV